MKYVDFISWEDCPHLLPPVMPAHALDEFERSLAPHQREARRKGIPSVGSGSVYPVSDDEILCEPFPIPRHWGQGYGLDVGWRVTAACFVAHDPDYDVFYVTAEYHGTEREPVTHTHAIQAMMPYPLIGAIDPAAEGSSQVDGKKLAVEYRKLGLDLKLANNAVEAGIHECLTRMQTGRLRVFANCQHWLKEKRLYRRKGDLAVGAAAQSEASRGRIIKANDHLLDAMRYAVCTQGLLKQAPAQASASRVVRYGEF